MIIVIKRAKFIKILKPSNHFKSHDSLRYLRRFSWLAALHYVQLPWQPPLKSLHYRYSAPLWGRLLVWTGSGSRKSPPAQAIFSFPIGTTYSDSPQWKIPNFDDFPSLKCSLTSDQLLQVRSCDGLERSLLNWHEILYFQVSAGVKVIIPTIMQL
jgi:hypothetical protein